MFATNALKHGMDIKTLSTIIGHVSSSTTLNVYAHVTDDMRQQAAVSIDRGIGKAAPQEAAPQETIRTMTDFKPVRGKNRRRGTGYLGQMKNQRWRGMYTILWTDGKRRTKAVYADTVDECEKLLAELIVQMKVEVAAEKQRMEREVQIS